jgi:HD superfamily phosphohydrolase YqeK
MDDDEWAKLSKPERIEHCRRTAHEAEESAQKAGLEMRDIYRRLAARCL